MLSDDLVLITELVMMTLVLFYQHMITGDMLMNNMYMCLFMHIVARCSNR